MNNYIYIVASLPSISQDAKPGDRLSAEDILQDIREQLSESDCALMDIIADSRRDECLTPEFYTAAAASKDRFIREYFAFDLNVRNAKARFLNKAFGRPAEQDLIILGEEENEFEEGAELSQILEKKDILERERGLDDFMWKKIDELTLFDYFDMDAILGFAAKLQIIDRWLKLDEQTGREMFKKLVNEVRSTFKGVEFEG